MTVSYFKYDGTESSELSFTSMVGVDGDTLKTVNDISKNLIEQGDRADEISGVEARFKAYEDVVIYYSNKFDKKFTLNSANIKVTRGEMKSAYSRVDESLLSALETSHKNIKKFHAAQRKKINDCWETETSEGVIITEKTTPLVSMGAYIPGGRATYPSTVLMTCTPAKVAGVKRVVVTSPPPISDAILAACRICGVDEVYRIGGAQAVFALAFGTMSIAKVDKIVGPGNKYVNAAKLQVFGLVDIDMPAGPSEILIIADEETDSKFAAADLLAQAEHDPDARCLLVTHSKEKEKEIREQLALQTKNAKRKTIIEESLKNNFYVCRTKNIAESITAANFLAPEHLEIMTKNPEKVAEKISNAGTIFVGNYAPVSAGDYATGSNHVLPTGTAARFASGLSVRDFLRSYTVQKINKRGLENLRRTIDILATAESLDAHAAAVRTRFE